MKYTSAYLQMRHSGRRARRAIAVSKSSPRLAERESGSGRMPCWVQRSAPGHRLFPRPWSQGQMGGTTREGKRRRMHSGSTPDTQLGFYPSYPSMSILRFYPSWRTRPTSHVRPFLMHSRRRALESCRTKLRRCPKFHHLQTSSFTSSKGKRFRPLHRHPSQS